MAAGVGKGFQVHGLDLRGWVAYLNVTMVYVHLNNSCGWEEYWQPTESTPSFHP
jgi:hypothetical protein